VTNNKLFKNNKAKEAKKQKGKSAKEL